MVALAHSQPQQPTTENQARYYVYGAFLTHAVPEIMGERVALGRELEQRLGLAPGADRLQIYDALMSYTDGKPLDVRPATAEELAKYKRNLKQPVFRVRAGAIALLVEYDMQANTIPFVGQLDVAPQAVAPAPKPVAPPVAVAPPPAPKPVAPAPVVTPAPKPAPAVAAVVPRPAPVKPTPVKPTSVRPAPPVAAPGETLKPNGPCIVTPVMSEQDLANCRAAPGRAARVEPGPPVVVKPQARVEPAAQPRRTGPCEVKPVMSEEDLANCRAAPGGAARVQPGPPAVVKPQARVEPAPQPKPTGPCEVKPVMSEEDLANCRAAPGGAARIQPGPPIVVKPQPRAEPTREPVRTRPCEVKPVMSEEDLAACGIRQ